MKFASARYRVTALPIALSAMLIFLISWTAASQNRTPRDFWRSAVKGPLTGPMAEEKWAASYRDAELPGFSAPYLEGTVMSVASTGDRQQVVLSMEGEGVGDAMLLFNGRGWKLRTEPPVGTVVRFWGVAREFTSEPFMITFEPSRVDGLDLERGVPLQRRPTR